MPQPAVEMRSLLVAALALPPDQRTAPTATEAAAKALRSICPDASNEAIHAAIAEAVGALMTQLGPEAFMAANAGLEVA